ncbi:MAG: hypothetical protein QNJ35_13560 [Paracoccaceae bacterium]|nr:hypothetical protein [Paracoccaceae bacterium]
MRDAPQLLEDCGIPVDNLLWRAGAEFKEIEIVCGNADRRRVPKKLPGGAKNRIYLRSGGPDFLFVSIA